jgi:hypothetical protein
MRRNEIEILVDLKGLVTGTVKGIKGPSCQAVIDQLAEIGRTESAAPTGEYYQEGKIHQIITCRKLDRSI